MPNTLIDFNLQGLLVDVHHATIREQSEEQLRLILNLIRVFQALDDKQVPGATEKRDQLIRLLDFNFDDAKKTIPVRSFAV